MPPRVVAQRRRACIVPLLAAVALGFGLLLPGKALAQDQDQIGADAAGVLLVQTGWTSEIGDISAARLRSEYCAGHVQKTERASIIADELFDCETAREFHHPLVFHPRSKDRLLLVDLTEAIPQMKTLTVNSTSFFREPSTYSLKLQEKLGLVPITHMIMTGTTAITRGTGRSADRYGPQVLTERVLPYFQKADYVHISNEVSFTDRCVFQPGLRFCSKQAHFQAFKDIRVNVVELTGNHNRDFGEKPFGATLAWFHRNGMRTFGGGSDEADANAPIFLDLKGGGAIGMIGFNELCPLNECATAKRPGANRFKIAKAREVIEGMRRARPEAFIIASVQFGETNGYHPTPSQRSISFALLDAGADLVFGSQAHQVQQMELHKGKVVLHGLGNFLFDQIHATGLRQGYFMNLYFSPSRLIAMEPVFTWIDEKLRPAIATEQQAALIRRSIYSDKLLYK
jgi:poly-gamma-glutamate capsule biosynthesis protein CapA/YwtB (metallophosphatase superfamily)